MLFSYQRYFTVEVKTLIKSDCVRLTVLSKSYFLLSVTGQPCVSDDQKSGSASLIIMVHLHSISIEVFRAFHI